MLKYIKQRDFEYVNQIPLESLQALSFNKEKGIIIAKWKKQKSTTIDLTIFHKNQNKLTKKEKRVRNNTQKNSNKF